MTKIHDRRTGVSVLRRRNSIHCKNGILAQGLIVSPQCDSVPRISSFNFFNINCLYSEQKKKIRSGLYAHDLFLSFILLYEISVHILEFVYRIPISPYKRIWRLMKHNSIRVYNTHLTMPTNKEV